MNEDNFIRPQTFADFIGQTQVKENLKMAVDAARKRGEQLDHVLLYGPPGLGKTTLAQIIANEMRSNARITSAPLMKAKHDLAAILFGLMPRDVFFMDEIHRLDTRLEEILYPAMEDFKLDLVIGRPHHLQPFTFVGATTRAGMITAPLRDRFGLVLHLEYYTPSELVLVVERTARILRVPIADSASEEIARRGRGTPRIVNRLVRRIRDWADVRGNGVITKPIAQDALASLGVDELGLENMDRKLLRVLAENGGPVGLNALAASLHEDEDSIEDMYEPYLMEAGLIARTPRGRIATSSAYTLLGMVEKPTLPVNLFA